MTRLATLFAALALLVAAGFGCGDDTVFELQPLDLAVPPADANDLALPVIDDSGLAAIVSVGAGGDNRFSPETIFIDAGGSVTWVWVNGVHSVVSDDLPAAFPASPAQDGGNYVVNFPTKGQLGYHCSVHGSAESGVVIVQ